MFEHLHAGHQVEARRALLGQGLHGHQAVVHLDPGLQGVQLRDPQMGLAQVDAQYLRPVPGHALGEDAAAATHVKDLPVLKARPARSM